MNDGGLSPINIAQPLRRLRYSRRINTVPGPEDLRSAVLYKGVPDTDTFHGKAHHARIAQALIMRNNTRKRWKPLLMG